MTEFIINEKVRELLKPFDDMDIDMFRPIYPIYSTGVTFSELKGEVAHYFLFGNCIKNCPDCHSKKDLNYFQNPIPCNRCWSVYDAVLSAIYAKNDGATAILLMGGTTCEGVYEEDIINLVNALSKILPVAIYSGLDEDEVDGARWYANLNLYTNVRWLKTGSYQKDKGGLDSPTTNQKFYERLDNGQWLDITSTYTRKD